ncbi:MAG: DUF4981 domain-containing protein [Defluviitaleaceae bacterium]|nr:DUF4981 domain-containing protein [Defluviitaleaceae bacterium]
MQTEKNFFGKPFWQDLDVTAVNRNLSHTKWRAFENETQAVEGYANHSKYVFPLNGTYLFKLFADPDSADNFFCPDNKREGFCDIPVPSCWELNGHGEPIYTNRVLPWDYSGEGAHMVKPATNFLSVPNPPHLPKDNPTGCYYKKFEVPSHFAGRDIFLRFDGVESSYYLWINGEPVGYSEDSKLPSEFDVTAYIKPGENSMALKVIRFPKSFYLEDQDYWHISGIHRDVWLVAKPSVRINDYKINAVPDLNRGVGMLEADINVSRMPGFGECNVKLAIFDADGNKIASSVSGVRIEAEYTMRNKPTANSARICLTVPHVNLWSPEKPYLYTAVFTLTDGSGNETDCEACRVGFKKVGIENGILKINGQRIVMHGTNRHEHYYGSGRTVPREQMIKEIIEMKRMNINSVRTCHYPDSPLWYDLCDEYGLLVICECNVETHSMHGQLTHDPSWAKQFLERAVRMVLEYKNHACVYSWSLGNESGTGPNHAAMAGFIREYDSTRLCQYEAGNPGKNVSDIRGDMYAQIERIMSMLTDPIDNRPVILVEYLYQIRNSGGGMHHFVDLTEKYERFQGGYTWDWSDKCLLRKNDAGETYFAYGGDFDESVTEWECPLFMTNNGLVLPNLKWKPVAYEVKQAYAPVTVKPEDTSSPWSIGRMTGRYVLSNKTYTRQIDEFTITATLREDGTAVASIIIETGVLGPLEKKIIDVNITYDYQNECEYFIEFSVTENVGSFYAQAGYEIGCFQFPLKYAAKKYLLEKNSCCKPNRQTVNVSHDENKVFIQCPLYEAEINKQTGLIEKYAKDNFNYFVFCGKPAFDRPYTGLDADVNWGWWGLLLPVRQQNMIITAEEIKILTDDKNTRAVVEVPFNIVSLKDGNELVSRVKIKYAFNSDGTIETDARFDICDALCYVPRAGLEIVLPKGFDNLSYYGCGENECYMDRMLSAKLAVHKSTVRAQHFPFIPPSETGGHEQTRWLALSDCAGREIKIKSVSPFHFSALKNSVADYQNATHDHKLPRREETFLHIDAAHAGIGSDMSWSIATAPDQRIKAGVYHLNFMMIF